MSKQKSKKPSVKQPNNIFGYHAVESALSVVPQGVKCIYLQSKQQNDKRAQNIIDAAKEHNIPLKYLTKEQLNKIDLYAKHQGIVAEVVYGGEYSEDYLKVILENHKDKLLLVILDGVQDPHNLGACLRTANAAGAHGVIIPKDKACGITPTVYKVASGAVGVTPIIQVTNLTRTIENLKRSGVWVYGTDENGQKTIYQTDFTFPMAIVFGNEGKGLRRLTKESCDMLVNIPMRGTVPSLNVSVALGVCLFEVVRKKTFI